ncbi:MAG: amidohydrolase [Bacillota bacterium]|nr:amidohydrolase [Bacillota bacterium]
MSSGIRTDQRHFADVLFRGGSVYTVDAHDTVAEACAVRGYRIIGVGRLADLLHLVGPATRIVDLEGRCLVPGLCDAHSHIVGHGLTMRSVDCKHDVASVHDIVRKVAAAATAAPPGKWIAGRGYNQNKLAERRHPNRHDLDIASPDRPVALTRTCGHIVACNSLALRLAGIDASTPDPTGGEIERDEAGEPTGILKEAACRPLWEFLAGTLETHKDGYLAACRDYLSYGITSAHDASGGDPVQIRAIIEAHNEGRAKLRTYMMLRFAAPDAPGDSALRAGLVSGAGGTWLRVGPLKAMVDGSSSGPTAATREPYHVRPDTSGILYYNQEQLSEAVVRGAQGGFQVTAHCVGDRAIEMMLSAIALTGPEAPSRRHRIEHCAMLDPGLIAELKRLGVVPVANPAFLWEFGDGYVQDYGPVRGGWMFPLRALFEAGIPAAAGSDAPVTYVDPYLGMYCAMTRRTSSGAVVGPEHAVTWPQALRAYTINGAYASREEAVKGSIEPGKLADLAVVEPDLGAVPAEEVRAARAVLTMSGGEVVYER